MYRLTHPQKRVWYNEKLYPHTSAHNIGGLAIIKGEIRLDLLQKAILSFIQRNNGALLQVVEEDGNPYQAIQSEIPRQLDFFDFSQEEDAAATFRHWADDAFKAPFQLLNSPLFYFAIFKVSNQEMGYLAKFHHLICDGWSIMLLSQQVVENYQLLEQNQIDESKSYPSYLDYVVEEEKYLGSERSTKDKKFWLEKFTTLPEIANKKERIPDLQGRRQSYTLNEATSQKIGAITGKLGCSLLSLYTAFFLIYFQHYRQQNDLVIGVPVFNRHGKKNKGIFGMYTSTMPLRVTVNSALTFSQLVSTVTNELTANFAHQRYPYDLLAQDLELRQKGYPSLYDLCVNYYNTRLTETIAGIPLENEELYNGNQLFDLQLIVKEWASTVTLCFDYKVTEYSPTQIADLFSAFEYMLDQIALNPEIRLSELELLPLALQREILAYSGRQPAAYPGDQVLPQLIEQQAQLTPDRIAVSFEDRALTYQQLMQTANRIARFLLTKGVKPNTFVGFMARKEIEVVTGILAILKAGAAYIPLDPATPQERVKAILGQAGTRYLLSNVSSSWGDTIEVLSFSDSGIEEQDSAPLPLAACPQDPVYLIFTSGSTGEPKGIVIEHRSLINYLWWAKETYLEETEVFALHSSLAFDLAVTSLFVPLLGGGQIRIYASNADEYALYKIVNENVATLVKLTPSELNLLVDKDNRHSSISRFIVGGEDLKVKLARDITNSFSPKPVEIYNEYGPTETVVGCMTHLYDPLKDTELSVPIGRPIPNVALYVLSDDLKLLPRGAVGELYIAGDCVGRGYLNRPELTQTLFLADPFVSGQRMYKSGDLVRLTREQLLEYLGRKDDQVKLRGYRIELGEIEGRIRQMEKVKDVVVVKQQAERGDPYLCAYVVATSSLKETEIHGFLATSLPDYMLPRQYVFLESLPLSASGKVDKKVLPLPATETSLDSEYLSPATEEESVLVDVLKEVLQTEKIGRNHDFLRLGGDSIKAIQVSAKLRQRNYSLQTSCVLSHPIIKEMAQHLEKNNLSKDNAPITLEGNVEPTPIWRWFLERSFNTRAHYYQSALFELHIPLPVKELTEMIELLLRRHDTLRINFDVQKPLFFYNPQHLKQSYAIKEYDLSALTLAEAQAAIEKIGQDLRSALDLTHDCLFRTVHFMLANNRRAVLFIAHHLIIDGVSWQILINDLLALFQLWQEKKPYVLTSKTTSYQDWSLALHRQQSNFEDQLEYWQNIIRHCNVWLFPKTERVGSTARHSLTGQLPLNGRILNAANKAYATKTSELLVVALGLVFYRWQNLTTLPIEIETHGREGLSEPIDLSGTVGWFTALFPICLSVESEDLPHCIKKVKDALRSVPTGGLGYGVLRHFSGLLPKAVAPLIRFNYLGEWDSVLTGSFLSRLDWDTGDDVASTNSLDCLMEMNLLVVGPQMEVSITYTLNHLEPGIAHEFLARYLEAVNEVIKHCQNRGGADFNSSDFDTLNLTEADWDLLFN